MGTSKSLTLDKMRILCMLTVSMLGLSVARHRHVDGDLDENDNLNLDDFEYQFNKKRVVDPAERAKRRKSLRRNEQIVREENEDFIRGQETWFAKVYSFADETKEEVLKEKTGGEMPNYSRGLGGLLPPENERRDNRSELYFDRIRQNRASVPRSYDSSKLGFVSEIKNQRQCGSCVSFATIAIVETCFKKLTGVFGDYSEQELVDCAYQQYGASGCNGAPFHAYTKWITVNKRKLTHENNYPYLNEEPKLRCPRNLKPYNQGAMVSDHFYTYSGDEETLKKMVYDKGAVNVGVDANQAFLSYSGGIFDSCYSDSINHAVAIVGYGTERGIDFWLVKNSWGADWGEKGFMKLKRGVKMCGIGKVIVTVDCKTVDGPTDAPQTTAKPCLDKYTNCADLARDNCFANAENCPKSCGKCDGMTPHPSNTCYNKFNNCNQHCNNSFKKHCKKACGLCNSASDDEESAPDCSDYWKNCKKNKKWYCGHMTYKNSCKKTCGLCNKDSDDEESAPDCSDYWNNCNGRYKNWYCGHKTHKNSCKKTCGLC